MCGVFNEGRYEEGNTGIWQWYQLHCIGRIVHWLDDHCNPFLHKNQYSIRMNHSNQCHFCLPYIFPAYGSLETCGFLLNMAIVWLILRVQLLNSYWFIDSSYRKTIKIIIWLSLVFATANVSCALNMPFWGKTCFINWLMGEIRRWRILNRE